MDDSIKGKVPFGKDEVEEYERKRYRGWDQKLVHAREVAILKRFLARIAEPGNLVLDLPCGYGRFAFLLSVFGLNPVGSDISFHMVNRSARAGRYCTASGPLGVVADAVRGLPFLSGAFFLVFSLRFFHHLHTREERMAVLHEFARVSHGWVIISYYQSNRIHRLQRIFRRRIKKSRTRIRMLERKEWEAEVRDAGLAPVKIIPLFKGLHSQHLALLRIDNLS